MNAHASLLGTPPASAPRDESDGPLVRQRAPLSAWFSLGVLVLVMVLSMVDKLIFTLVAEPLRHALALSDTQLGLLQGVAFTLASAVAMLPFGWAADRLDRRWVLAASVVLWSACGALRGTADGFSALFYASVGLGLAEGSPIPVNNSLIPDLFPRSQRVVANTVFGLVTLLAASLGAALGGAAVTLSEAARPHLPAAMQHLDTWRLAFFATAAAGVPIALLVLATPRAARGRYDAHTAAADQASRQEFGDYLRAHWRTLAGVVGGTGLTMVGFSAVGTWIPIMVARRFGVSPQQLGNGVAVSFFLATLAGTALAIIGMKFARRRMGPAGTLRLLALCNLAFALLAPLLIFVRSSFEVFCVLGLIVTPLITNVLISPNATQDLAPAPLRSRTAGVMSMVALLFQVFGPLAIGSLSDTFAAISPNALVIAIVSLTLVMGTLGALLLRATEASFARLVATLVGRAEA
jgi:MFS family permease